MNIFDKINAAIEDAGATLTTLDEDQFVIFPGWASVSKFNASINEALSPNLWEEWRPIYDALDTLKRYGSGTSPYSGMRLGKIDLQEIYDDSWRIEGDMKRLHAYRIVKEAVDKYPDLTDSYYSVPDGLYDTDSVLNEGWGFSDEYDTCTECGTAIRTKPDSYGWQLEAWKTGYNYICAACVNEHYADEYLEDYVNKNKLFNTDLVSLSENGWVQVDIDFENGWHRGQNADPNAILEFLGEYDIDVVFTGSIGQFDIRFWVWVREGLDQIAHDILLSERDRTRLPYDPGTEMAKVLRGEHSDHYHAETKEVSVEDFIEGNF